MGRGLPGLERLPRRAARDRLDLERGRLVEPRLRRRDRRRRRRRDAGRRDRRLRPCARRSCATRRRRCRSRTARRTPSSATGSSARPRTASASSASRGSHGHAERRVGPPASGRPLATLVAVVALLVALAAAPVAAGGGRHVRRVDRRCHLRRVDRVRGRRHVGAAARADGAADRVPGRARAVHRRRARAGDRRHARGPLRAGPHRRRTPRPEHPAQLHLGRVPGDRRRAGGQRDGAHPVPRHEPGLEDAEGRPDHGPLVGRAGSRSRARRSTSASRRSATRPRCSA